MTACAPAVRVATLSPDTSVCRAKLVLTSLATRCVLLIVSSCCLFSVFVLLPRFCCPVSCVLRLVPFVLCAILSSRLALPPCLLYHVLHPPPRAVCISTVSIFVSRRLSHPRVLVRVALPLALSLSLLSFVRACVSLVD